MTNLLGIERERESRKVTPYKNMVWGIFFYLSVGFWGVVSAECYGTSSVTNYVTTNRIYRNFTTKDSLMCTLQCNQDDVCVSYNYEYQPLHSSEHICQLSRCGSNGTLVAKWGFWFHQLKQTKKEDVCSTRESNSDVCNEGPLGLESGAIVDSRMTASSIYSAGYAAHSARLNLQRPGKPAAWAARTKSVGEWIQVDLSKVTKVTAIATQGSMYETEWVISYRLKYSNDVASFQDYDAGKIFTGNTDIDTVVKNELKPAISARYIRVYPQTWKGHPSMRMELYGCY